MQHDIDFDLNDLPNEVDASLEAGGAKVTAREFGPDRLPVTPSEWAAFRVGSHAKIVDHTGRKSGKKAAGKAVIDLDERPEEQISITQWLAEQEPNGVFVQDEADALPKATGRHVNRSRQERSDLAKGQRVDMTELVDAVRKNPDVIFEEQQFSPGSWNVLCAGDYMPAGRTSITVAKVEDAYYARATANIRSFFEAALKGGGLMEEHGHLLDALPQPEVKAGRVR